jgi:hypothetical protein
LLFSWLMWIITSFPLLMIAIRSPRRSASSMKWVDMMIVRPKIIKKFSWKKTKKFRPKIIRRLRWKKTKKCLP